MNEAVLGTDFQLPILFFRGTEGADSPAWLAKEYFDKIHAPHLVVWSSTGQFLKELVTRVRPLEVQT